MARAPFYDKNGVKKGAWSIEEDHKLRSYIQRYGHCNWRELPKYAGLKRCGKSCRLRWMNYLRPQVKHGNYTEEEDTLIMKLHEEFGNRWSTIAANLPGRTDNEVKNHWHSHLKKRAKRDLMKFDHGKHHSNYTTSYKNSLSSELGEAESVVFIDTPSNMILESSQYLSPTKSSTSTELSSSSLNSTFNGVEDICQLSSSSTSSEMDEAQFSSGYFWSEPFVLDNIYEENGYQSSSLGLPLPYDMYYDDSFHQLWP